MAALGRTRLFPSALANGGLLALFRRIENAAE
jgi:hypothetical protein